MANTQGMSDETVASLLTPDPPVAATKTKSAFALRQERIRQRMNEPIGERPAATVIRPSPPTTNRVDSVMKNVEHDSVLEEEEEQISEEAPPPILGAVVERNVAPCHVQNSARGTVRKSKFASQRNKNGSSIGGFPSVHMPVGTFVKDGAPPREKSVDQARSTQQQQAPVPQQNSTQQDSQALLVQMTPDEIQEEVQELKAALSPEMIRFLQKRGRQKAQANTTASKPVSTAETSNTKNVEESRNDVVGSSLPTDDLEEKKRVASLLSSVQTPEELDAVYAKETGITTDEDEVEEKLVEDDFQTATKLLRSTSPRQALWAARVVCQRLEEDVAAGKSSPVGQDDNNAWPYPTVLSVSLRCLLDSPLSHSNGFLLHTHVLRSLYALLRLRANSNHVVDVTCATDTDASIFQEYFMDDAVPSPAFGTCYPTISVRPIASTKDGDAVAYSTSSSSTSAQQDGVAFGKDPMWTLLTRMRILPRLAELLSVNIPDEAIVAICGILSMLSVRSTGTASAIAQHPAILSLLLKNTLLPPTDGESDTQPSYPGFFNTQVALPAIVFLCTLARQSRTAAAIPVDSILPQIVAMKAETDSEHQLQKWSLILWRTMLRYGLGLSSLNTFITLSIPHLASSNPTKYSLSTEFLNAFANVCYCVRVAKSKPEGEWKNVMSLEDREVLAMALACLATTVRQTIRHVSDVDSLSSVSAMRLMAARFRFLQSYFAACEQGNSELASGQSKLDEDDNIDWNEMVEALDKLSECEILKQALEMVPSCGFVPCTLDGNEGWVDVVSPRQEASACAFIDSLASILYTISISDGLQIMDGQSQETSPSVLSQFSSVFVNWMNNPDAISTAVESQPMLSIARKGWLNATTFHVIRFALVTDEFSEESARSHAFSLIGRLQLGEEAFVAMLFSSDILFRTGDESQSATSPLSSFLMQELCATTLARKQLDHSFKLHYGFGITAAEWGPFDVGTLLSETDVPDARSATPFSELLLPMGPLWLWKILSGTVDQEAIRETEVDDETEILGSCLELLVEIENDESSLSNSYATQVANGAKLYYLLNIFLHSESVLRDDRIGSLVVALFKQYTANLKEGTPFVEAFWKACLDHSQISNGKKPGDSDSLGERDQQLFSMLMGRRDITEKELRPLIDFVADVCKAYLEFGAQYESFTRCIRLFLSVGFPSQVRCEVIRSLREVLHLLTLSEEEGDSFGNEVATTLNLCLFGGTVEPEEGVRDSPEFLDLVSSVIKEDETNQGDTARWSAKRGGFFFLLAVASLTRSIVTSSQDGCGEGVANQRLTMLLKETRDIVLEAVERLNGSGGGDRTSLVLTVMNVVKARG